MEIVTTLNPAGQGRFVLTCEHASHAVPIEYDALGLDAVQLQEHIGWDIGAAAVTTVVSRRLGAPAVLAGVSRLVIDCNRDVADGDLIVAESGGIGIPGNAALKDHERLRRISDFYVPYHCAVDDVLQGRDVVVLLSVHSFTPNLNGRERRFDIGVLFDTATAEARALGDALSATGLRVRYNEPYSGLDGLIFSAKAHGVRHRLPYLEIEINNALLRSDAQVRSMATAVVSAVRVLV